MREYSIFLALARGLVRLGFFAGVPSLFFVESLVIFLLNLSSCDLGQVTS